MGITEIFSGFLFRALREGVGHDGYWSATSLSSDKLGSVLRVSMAIRKSLKSLLPSVRVRIVVDLSIALVVLFIVPRPRFVGCIEKCAHTSVNRGQMMNNSIAQPKIYLSPARAPWEKGGDGLLGPKVTREVAAFES